MRILLASVLICGSAATALAQRPKPVPVPVPAPVVVSRIVVSDGVLRAEMPSAPGPHSADWPSVLVPARSLKAGVDPTVPEFRIRGWYEAGGARVVVFAVSLSEPSRVVREQQIASVFVPVDKYVEVAATEKYRARRLTLTAYGKPGRPPSALVTPPAPPAVVPYEIRPRYIDIPVRPWNPPQR